MPDLFSPLAIKGVTLRNRIAMSPMTQHRAVDGRVDDFHVMLTGSRAAGGFGLVFPEQIAITPDGRTSVRCAGLWEDGQIEGLAIREEAIDLVMLGRPALSNPHWPVWAARALAHPDPFSLVPEDWGWWLRSFRAHPDCIGWPSSAPAPGAPARA
jgi:2,4-dienoyl-CoA reductase-like NADH-dependent reductase (Old Yellow Enzyme family)